jgi:Mor family transcriptional regulator
MQSDRLSGYNITFELFRQLYIKFEKDIAQEIIKLIITELGGKRVTFPSWDQLYRLQRNQQIFRYFTGTNTSQLARQFGLSNVQIRKIVRQVINGQ